VLYLEGTFAQPFNIFGFLRKMQRRAVNRSEVKKPGRFPAGFFVINPSAARR
jgi:hypothetical protein